MSCKILIGADIAPVKSNYDLFARGNGEALVGHEVLELLQSADFVIMNLETPLTDIQSPIKKCGPNLIAPTKVITGLKAINSDFYTLANNHILDQGEKGLLSTIKLLRANGIEYAGAGMDIKEASRYFIKELSGIRLGIYCCAEHEFTIATENSPGANPFDPLESFDHVIELKSKCDILIVLYHGGKEYYRYPSPQVQKIFRKFSEKGADIVIAQHTHCIGCMESYKGSTLIYGQGNFLFDNQSDEFWNSGLLIELNVNERCHSYEIYYHPLRKQKNGIITMADKEVRKLLLEGFEKRTKEIMSTVIVNERYMDYAMLNFEMYLRVLHGNNLVFRVINKLMGGGYVFRKYKYPESLNSLRNYVECEAHREIILKGIESCMKNM